MFDPERSRIEPAAANEIIISRVLHAPRALVWQAMTDPQQVALWWVPEGFTTTTEQFDLRVGGVWKHVMVGPDGVRYPNKSVFTVVNYHEQISYTHSGAKEHAKGAHFESTWLFEEINAWTTKLTIRMVFASAADRDHVVSFYGALQGGQQTLARLEGLLTSRGAAAAPAAVQLTITRSFRFTAEQVFDAWLDPVQARLWLFATPTGRMTRVEIDARVGGRFVIVEERAGVPAYHCGEYLEITRPHRLVFRFGVDESLQDAGRVELVIVPRAVGCELTLTHSMADKYAEYRQRTEQGWRMILDTLANNLL